VLVGVGRWGTNHLRVWQRLHSEGLCRLIGVQDSDERRLRDVTREFGVKGFTSLDVIKEADAVDIVVPTYNHFDVVQKALAAGKHVMVEKPVTETLAQAKKIKKGKGVFMVGHLFRYNPATEYVKKLIVEKELGAIRFLRGRFMGFRFPEHDAGVLATTAIHFIYVSNFFMGRSPKSVWARTEHMLGTKLDDFSLMRLDYGDAFTIIEAEYFTPGKWRTFDVVGTQGAVTADLLNQAVDIHRKRHVRAGERFEAYDGGVVNHRFEFQEPLDLEIHHFLKCIREGSEPDTGLSDGIETLKIIEAAYQSARTGKPVALR
jgi:UDP-N-acetylglucosamine 3-dehydrogenase